MSTKNVSSVMYRLITLVLLCAAFLIGGLFTNVSSAHAAPAIQENHQNIAVPSHPATSLPCSNQLVRVVIWYNHGNNCFGVTRTGYNGLDFSLYNVTHIGVVGCVNSGWLRAYNGGPGFYSYFNTVRGIYQGPQPPYNFMTQIDIVATC